MNVIIAGVGRNGKTTLARRVNEELGHFVISLDKLMTAFAKAYPQLDVRIAWDYGKATANVAPFLGHYLGMLSSGQGHADELSLRRHHVAGNRFVLEGGHFDFEAISSILKAYGIDRLSDAFALIGLASCARTADERYDDLRRHDTEDDWTYGLDDGDLRRFCEMSVEENRAMADYLSRHGFTVYDTSHGRERVFGRIIADLRSRMR